MGWKTIKEAYQIRHSVQVTEKGICIGSPYVHDLAVIDVATGRVSGNDAFWDFVADNYPALAAASPDEVLALVKMPDEFTTSITVYTYDGGSVIEKQCEEAGWPNVTHDGCMMYENTFSTDKAEVVAWAKRNADSAISWQTDNVTDMERKLAEARERLAKSENARANLDADYPDIEAAS